MSDFSPSRKDFKKSNLIGIVIVTTLFAIFGLTTNAAIADSNETSSGSDNAYIQSSISAGGNSTCVLLSGAAKCWGANESGQLGNGTRNASFSPVAVSGLSAGVTSISVGNNHACAVVSGGVKCWGANESGQLGDGSTTASLTPVSVSGLTSGVTAVSVAGSKGMMSSSSFSCAVVSGGVKCWGANGSGQLGDGSTTASLTPVSVSGLTSGVTAISVAGSASFMSSSGFSCAVVSGGVKCWGANGSGQLGDASTTASQIPVSVSGLTSGVTAISVAGSAGMMSSSGFSCAVVSGGAKCWGANESGQLGNASTTASQIPVSVSGLTSGVAAISLGASHACAVNASALKCWGDNSSGQAGPTAFAATQVVGLTSGVTSISAGQDGENHVCAIQTESLKCWGYNAYGQLGNGSTSNAHTPQQVVGLTAGVTAVDGYTCAVVSGAVKCWGRGGISQSSSPVLMHALSNVSNIINDSGSCVVISGGMNCWGQNYYGQLGIGSTTGASTPTQVVGLTTGVTSISAGNRGHVCAVVSAAAKCWGSGSDGKLGNGSTTMANTPQQVIDLDSGVTAISAGSYHSCAVVSGAAKCWGNNDYGRLGDGTSTNSTSPVQVAGLTSGVTAIAAGDSLSCAIVNEALKCWGYNGNGQLGDGTTNSSLTPKSVIGLSSGVSAITLAYQLACAVKDGAAKCWGNNTFGALGDGTFALSNYFVITRPQEIVGIGPLTTTSTSSSTTTVAPSTTTTVAPTTTTVPANTTTTTVVGSTTTSTAAPKSVTTTTVAVSAAVTTTTIATAPAGTVAQGQVSVETIAPISGPTTTVLAPMQVVKTQKPRALVTTTTTVPPVVTTIAGAPVGVAPDAPAVGPGEASVVNDGRAVKTTISRAENQITATAGTMSTTLSGLTSKGKRVALDANGNLVVRRTERLVLSATGFEADRDVAVWVYSSPTQLGVIKTSADGTISGAFDLPSGLEVGNHRLVLESKKSDGQTSVVALGFSYATSDSGSAMTRLLIVVPIFFAMLFGLFLPAISRRRKKEAAAQ